MDVAPAPLGIVKPAGVAMMRLELPTVKGWNAVEPRDVSPKKTTGLVTIVPTAVFELVTATLTVTPVRIACTALSVRVMGFNCADTNAMGVSAEVVVVVKLTAFHTMPEGVSVTVAVPLLKAGADAVS